jgi:hypothetical protein
MNIDEQILGRLDELIALGEGVLETQQHAGPYVLGDDRVDGQLASQWATSSLGLLERVFGPEDAHYKKFSEFAAGALTFSPCNRALGALKAAREDYAGGHLASLRILIEAEVLDDLLDQGHELLSAGYYQPAAVLVGAVLEDSLRKACERNSIGIKMGAGIEAMNMALSKAGVYSRLVQKRVTTYAEVRNSAAHGRFDDFLEEDVKEMLLGVRRLVDEFSA